MFRYGLVCSLETLTPDKPSVFQGPLEGYADTVRSIGYDARELHLRNPGQVDPDKLRRRANDAGLDFFALIVPMRSASGKLARLQPFCSQRYNGTRI